MKYLKTYNENSVDTNRVIFGIFIDNKGDFAKVQKTLINLGYEISSWYKSKHWFPDLKFEDDILDYNSLPIKPVYITIWRDDKRWTMINEINEKIIIVDVEDVHKYIEALKLNIL